jgi:hypothetical protein
MGNYSIAIPSGSALGKPILVVGTDTGSATIIHTCSTNPNVYHEVWIWAQNNHTSDVVLTIEYGDSVAPNSNIIKTISAKNGLLTIVAGHRFKGAASPPIVKAFAGTGNVISLIVNINVIDIT